MGWLGILAAVALFVFAVFAPVGGTPGVLFSLLLALFCLAWGVLRVLQDRLKQRNGDELELLSPAEIRALRERAAAVTPEPPEPS